MAQGPGGRRNWCRGGILGAIVLAAMGCAGKDKTETGMRGMDPRVKAALTTPSTDLPKSKLATTDPGATGSTGMDVRNSFGRTTPNNGLPANGQLVSIGAAVPTPQTTGGNLTLQKPIEVARTVSGPPVMPSDGPLPKPIMPVSAMAVKVPLENPTPTEPLAPVAPAQPIVAVGAVPAPYPPPAPSGLPVAPAPGLLMVPSISEKPVSFPAVPPGLK